MDKIHTQAKEPILEIKNVNKDYGHTPILRNINLLVNSGDFVYIVGSNGAGKSTLLNIISHDDVPDNGQISVGNYRLDKLKKKDLPYFRRTIGYMHQNTDLIPEMTIKENLMYPLEALGYDKETIRKRYEDTISLTGLYDYRNSRISHDGHYLLSGGQLQMVSIAQALVNKPEILICDEPTGHLDPEASAEVMDFLEKLPKINTAVLVVTHDTDIVKNRPHQTYYLDKNTHTLEKIDVKGGNK